ncbi:MAG: DUF4198 domain-containing protein [Phycisphaerales bacterium]|nr:DUF4198 domain-containing protein [Phycisphaerales bacterium]
MKTQLLAGSACIVAFAAAPARSHDLWLEPSTFSAKVNELIHVSIRVGEHFKGEPVPRDPARIERFVMLGPEGERPVAGKEGDEPAGMTRAGQAGVHAIGYVTYGVHLELEAEKFESYLKEKGFDRIIEERARLGESKKAGREEYSRSVKSLVRAGDAGADGFDRALGLPLELAPVQNPFAVKTGDKIAFKLLLNGKPLAGALVDAMSKRGESTTPPQSARTDERGEVAFTLGEPGTWLLCAVHMERSTSEKAEWRSTWTSLTFETSVPSATTTPPSRD